MEEYQGQERRHDGGCSCVHIVELAGEDKQIRAEITHLRDLLQKDITAILELNKESSLEMKHLVLSTRECLANVSKSAELFRYGSERMNKLELAVADHTAQILNINLVVEELSEEKSSIKKAMGENLSSYLSRWQPRTQKIVSIFGAWSVLITGVLMSPGLHERLIKWVEKWW